MVSEIWKLQQTVHGQIMAHGARRMYNLLKRGNNYYKYIKLNTVLAHIFMFN